MRKFNQSDYDQLHKYEDDFRRAIDSRYATGIYQEEFDQIHKIYKETLNRQASSSCGGCVIQMLSSVGRLYFAYKKEMEAKAELEKKQKRQNRKPRNTQKKEKEVKDVQKVEA